MFFVGFQTACKVREQTPTEAYRGTVPLKHQGLDSHWGIQPAAKGYGAAQLCVSWFFPQAPVVIPGFLRQAGHPLVLGRGLALVLGGLLLPLPLGPQGRAGIVHAQGVRRRRQHPPR